MQTYRGKKCGIGSIVQVNGNPSPADYRFIPWVDIFNELRDQGEYFDGVINKFRKLRTSLEGLYKPQDTYQTIKKVDGLRCKAVRLWDSAYKKMAETSEKFGKWFYDDNKQLMGKVVNIVIEKVKLEKEIDLKKSHLLNEERIELSGLKRNDIAIDYRITAGDPPPQSVFRRFFG